MGHCGQAYYIFVRPLDIWDTTSRNIRVRLPHGNDLLSETGKKQETGVSRHHRDPIKGPPKTPQYDSVLVYGGYRPISELVSHEAERRMSLGQLHV